MNICVITDGYPSLVDPGRRVFVDQLVSAWADQNINVNVISPIPYFVEFFDKTRFYAKEWVKKTPGGNKVKVFSPRFFRASDRNIAFFETRRISYQGFQKSVEETIKKLPQKPDVLYGHFLLPAGCQAGDIGQRMGIPAFCAFGESSLWSIEGENIEKVRKSLSKLTGMVSVSTENKRILVDQKLYREKDIEVFPNGVDHSLFCPGNRQELRKKLGFPEGNLIGVYTGSFNEDKGILRAQAAALKAGNVKMVYIGKGDQKPEGENILFQGKLVHDKIPEYLNAADFFILPTKAEGCCNAIIEAIACGLPVISSTGAYNDDILTEDYSIRTDPTDVEAMAEAIRTIRDHPQRRAEMSAAAREASLKFDVVARATAICHFMQCKMEKG